MNKISVYKKQKIIKRYLNGEKVEHITKTAKVSKSTVYSLIRQYNEKHDNIASEVETLRKLAERQQKMIEILKTVDCTVSAPLKEKLSAMEKLYGKYNNHLLCETMEVDRGTFLNHIKRSKGENNWYNQRREELKIQIQKLFEDNNQISGSKKITALLRKQYVNVSEEMVRELMNELGLKSVRTNSKKEYIKEKRKKNILKQQFKADSPNKVWVSDVTVFSYGDYYYYICAIIDLFSRKVVAYHISKHNSTQLVKTTMKRAITSRKPSPGLILHTDKKKKYEFTSLKNSKSRVLSLSEQAYDILDKYCPDSSLSDTEVFIFQNRKKTHFTPAALYNSFKKVVKSIGLPKVTFHDLRHTHAVLSLKAGMDIKTLQYNLGHYSAAFTLDVYGHCLNEMQIHGAEQLSTYMKKFE